MSLFVRVVDAGSFSAAGAAEGLSSQLVGKYIGKLEQHLGVQLLMRTTRRQSLTDFGRLFYERAKIILTEVDYAESMAAEIQAVPTGRLRINAPVSFGMYALAPRLPDYMCANPAVMVDLSLSNRLVDLVEEGFDAVFRVGSLADSRLVSRTLLPHRLVLCAAPSYLSRHEPISHPLELQNHACLTYAHTELKDRWTFQRMDETVGVPVTSRMVADHGEPLLRAALAGMGIILQPVELTRHSLATGHLQVVLPEWSAASRPMHLLYAPDRRLTPKLRSFLDFAVAAFG
ncbi:LysR substrate-binding domain-containing protein [Acetobacter senegalensis]|uniref:LysR substrate-binding domain-containing protein n=1 Tax=Acetobacter senegalensis TaxID=446692 RepID=UPI00264E5EFD|nr:LysR substrate-binding domain-containing protein [Acetobacter senegalensis]MDN7356243.1 LysR substrate-binding domain-containing protein [Acetobacter senegalensis]